MHSLKQLLMIDPNRSLLGARSRVAVICASMVGAFALGVPSARAALTMDQCADVDLSAGFGPPRDQGSSGWCHAFAAADLIGYAQGFGTNVPISAVDVALSEFSADAQTYQAAAIKLRNMGIYKNSGPVADKVREIETSRGSDLKALSARSGSLFKAILAYNGRGGACLESKLRSQASIVFKSSGDYIASLMGGLNYKVDGDLDNEKPKSGFEREFGCKAPPAVGRDQLLEWRRELNRSTLENVDRNVQSLCGERTPTQPMMPLLVMRSADDRDGGFEKEIAGFLKAGKPLAVTIRSAFLKSARTDAPFDHEALLVGSRWNGE